MGITGTDVTKDAGDIQTVIRNILSGNVAEVSVMVLAPLAGMPIPLLPLQTLWLNLVTDGLPARALASSRPSPGR